MKARIVTFWGTRYRITPRLIDKVFGDGKKIIYIQPLNTRPNYYLCRIDSKTDINSDDFYDEVLECEGGIYEEIEDQFGKYRGIGNANYPFPSLDLDSGCVWGMAEEKVEN